MKTKKLKYLCLSFLILLSLLLGLSSYADKGLQGKGKGDAMQPGDRQCKVFYENQHLKKHKNIDINCADF